MILPATILQFLGFIDRDNNKLEEKPQKGNLILARVDTGKTVIVKLTGNKEDITEDDVEDFFDSKAKSIIKQTEIKQVAAELEDVEEYADMLEDALDEFKEKFDGKPDRKTINAFKKDWKMKKASEIVYNIRRMKIGSVIRVAVSFSTNGISKMKFRGKIYPVITSRALIYKKDDEGNLVPSTTGLYYFSQRANQIPVTVSPIFNAEKESLEMFTVSLSPLARIEHFHYLIEHFKRTFAISMESEGKIFVPRIKYDWETLRKEPEILNLIKEINELSKNKEFKDLELITNKFTNLSNSIKKETEAQEQILVSAININLGFLITPEYFISDTFQDSPFTKLEQSLVNLNFAKLDPSDKKFLRVMVKDKINLITNANFDCSISAIYQTPALKLSEEPDSWGFMTDNLQSASFILGSRSSAEIVKELEKVATKE